jgi:hypothetical protein
MFNEEHIIKTYCMIDDIVKQIQKMFLPTKSGRKSKITRSMYLLLMVLKQECQIPTTKKFYAFVRFFFKRDIPNMPSYQQFCKGFEDNICYFVMIIILIMKANKKKSANIFSVDSTLISLCSNKHRHKSKLGKGIAKSSKNADGWFFGFKIHAIINHNMEIVSIKITPANANDIKTLDRSMIKGLTGYLIGDKGYISKERFEEFLKMGLKLITPVRKNMKKLPMLSAETLLYKMRKRSETVWGVLKERLSLVYKYARSLKSYFSHIFASLVIYSLNLDNNYKQEMLISQNSIS